MRERKIVFSIIALFLIVSIISINLVSSQFGFDNPDLPKVTREAPAIITFNNVTGSVNSSDFWDDLNTFNSTVFEEQSGAIFGIKFSWLTSFINAWFTTKTTDDLTQGSTNFYDNQSWNETLADSLYSQINEPLWSANSTTVARIGNCGVGTVVHNITDSGVECIADATGSGGGADVKSGTVASITEGSTSAVSFTTNFASTPQCTVSFNDGSIELSISQVESESTTGFTIRVLKIGGGGNTNRGVGWICTDGGNP